MVCTSLNNVWRYMTQKIMDTNQGRKRVKEDHGCVDHQKLWIKTCNLLKQIKKNEIRG